MKTLSNQLEDGEFEGVIRECLPDKTSGRISIVIDNSGEDGLSVGKASWKVWKDDGSINEDGGADAFNAFAVGVLDRDEDLSEEEIDEVCQEMTGKKIHYRNVKHFSKKTNKFYNRFTFLNLLEIDNGEVAVEEAELESEAAESGAAFPDVMEYALDKLEYKFPVKRVEGNLVIAIEGMDLLHRHCDKKGQPEDREHSWSLAQSGKGTFPWEFNLSLEQAFFKANWRYRYINKKGWRAWEKNNH